MTTTNQNPVFSGTGTGTSTPINPSDRDGSTIRFQVVLTSTGTIGWQHTVDGTNWVSIQAVRESTLASSASATASDIYTINASASFAVRANVSANGSGMTITGTVVKGAGGGGAGSGGGGGAVTIADGADVALGATTDAAVTTNADGTVNAHIRGLVALMAATPSAAAQVSIWDPTLTNNVAVKAASTAAVAGDVAVVVAVSPNNVVKVGDGTTSLVIKAASTAAVAGDVSAVMALSPNSPLPAGTNHVGSISGHSLELHPTVTVTAAGYTAANNVGGLITIAAGRAANLYVTLQDIEISDHANNASATYDIVFFKSTPAATFTDKSAFPTLSAADLALISGKLSIATTDGTAVGGARIYAPTFQSKVMLTDGSGNIYMAINASVAPTFANTTDFKVKLGFFQD